MNIKLGKIDKVKDLRSVWKHETKDFSNWLSQEENLSLLSESIGIEIQLDEKESSIGNFNVDLFAHEENTERKIIIENQLEETNHDHLGKIITYAAGKEAEVIIWIVKKARDEHRQAVEWLNQHTDNNIGVFLIEIELWKINDSIPAPKFNIVERPNDWTKTMKSIDGLSESSKLQLEFWQEFNNYASKNKQFINEFNIRKPYAHNWYDISIGNSISHICLDINITKNITSVGLYIKKTKSLFVVLRKQKDLIEKELGCSLVWKEASKDCRIMAIRDIQIANKNSWHEYFEWYCDMTFKFKKLYESNRGFYLSLP